MTPTEKTLRQALEPFAKLANKFDAYAESSGLTSDVAGWLHVSDLRRAREALAATQDQGQESGWQAGIEAAAQFVLKDLSRELGSEVARAIRALREPPK